MYQPEDGDFFVVHCHGGGLSQAQGETSFTLNNNLRVHFVTKAGKLLNDDVAWYYTDQLYAGVEEVVKRVANLGGEVTTVEPGGQCRNLMLYGGLLKHGKRAGVDLVKPHGGGYRKETYIDLEDEREGKSLKDLLEERKMHAGRKPRDVYMLCCSAWNSDTCVVDMERPSLPPWRGP